MKVGLVAWGLKSKHLPLETTFTLVPLHSTVPTVVPKGFLGDPLSASRGAISRTPEYSI